MNKKIMVAIVALGLAVLFLGWGYFPLGTTQSSFIVDNLDGAAWLTGYTVTLETPPRVRLGEVTSARLMLTPPVTGAFAPPEGMLYVAEARLELPGVVTRPSDAVTQTLRAGEPVTFFWQLRAAETGDVSGAAWLFVDVVSADGALLERIPVSAQGVESRVEGLAGLNSGTARGVGWGAFLLGLVMLFLGRTSASSQ